MPKNILDGKKKVFLGGGKGEAELLGKFGTEKRPKRTTDSTVWPHNIEKVTTRATKGKAIHGNGGVPPIMGKRNQRT